MVSVKDARFGGVWEQWPGKTQRPVEPDHVFESDSRPTRSVKPAAVSVWPAASDWLFKRCCRDTATTATRAMFPREGAASVERVFEHAFADFAPRPSPSAKALSPALSPATTTPARDSSTA